MKNQLLVIFVKNPKAGKVKTRLAATIGEEMALAVYVKLLKHTHKVTSELKIAKAVFYSDYVDHEDLWDNSEYLKFNQVGNNLGERMENAFRQGFDQGFRDICIIGSDCYQLTATHLQSAFDYLDKYQIVIGPSVDGGYYLLGMNYFFSIIFNNKIWSTSKVFVDTINDIENLKLKYTLLEPLIDVDDESDLHTMGNNL